MYFYENWDNIYKAKVAICQVNFFNKNLKKTTSQKDLTDSCCHWDMDMLAFPFCLLRTVRFFYKIEKFLLIIVKFTFSC